MADEVKIIIEVRETINSIKTIWNKENKITIAESGYEIQKPDELFDEIDDSLAKVADVQSSK